MCQLSQHGEAILMFGTGCHELNMAAISIYPNLLSVASLELGQSYDSPSTSEVTLGDMGKIGRDLSTTKTANLNGVRIFLYVLRHLQVQTLRYLLQWIMMMIMTITIMIISNNQNDDNNDNTYDNNIMLLSLLLMLIHISFSDSSRWWSLYRLMGNDDTHILLEYVSHKYFILYIITNCRPVTWNRGEFGSLW